MAFRFSDYPRSFWVANVMELFERAAYYGLNSVLAIYLTDSVANRGLGFSESDTGFLQAIIYAATYVIPILGGALADQFGYRRMLLVAFSFLSAGYIAAGYASAFSIVFFALAVMATGAGLFKPIISGTIARTTDEKTSAFGFGIYYWMINLGAFLAPLVVTWLRARNWLWVFIASGIYTGAMIIPALFLYRDPPAPAGPKKTLGDAMRGAAEVLGDARFMLMIVVYSGFWVLYFQNFTTILFYLRDFVDKGPIDRAVNGALSIVGVSGFSFDAEHVTVINALTIILLQVVVSFLVKDLPALPTMVGGMVIGALGFTLLAVSQNPWFFVAGIAVFSIGEMTAHPKYYSFIGLVAPPDRKAVYMGYAFLYGVFGGLLGPSIGTAVYESVLKPTAGTPAAGSTSFTFWITFAVFDLFAAAALFFFAKRFGEDTAATRRAARTAMIAVYIAIAALGLWFLYLGYSAGKPKMIVQALIFVALGSGGLLVTLRGKAGAAAPART